MLDKLYGAILFLVNITIITSPHLHQLFRRMLELSSAVKLQKCFAGYETLLTLSECGCDFLMTEFYFRVNCFFKSMLSYDPETTQKLQILCLNFIPSLPLSLKPLSS